MAANDAERRRRRIRGWSILNPAFRVVLALFSAVPILMVAVLDYPWHPRAPGDFFYRWPHSLLFGLALGLVAAAVERALFRWRHKFMFDFHSASIRQRMRWRFQKHNLLHAGWLVLAIWVSVAYLFLSKIALLPFLLALNVPLVANLKPAGKLLREIEAAKAPEAAPPARG